MVNLLESRTSIFFAGHCQEALSGAPPRGLQFTLGTKSKPEMFDTIVMANLVGSKLNLPCMYKAIEFQRYGMLPHGVQKLILSQIWV